MYTFEHFGVWKESSDYSSKTMFLVPFKNGWIDLAELKFAGSVGVRGTFLTGKTLKSASGFAGKTGQNR